MATGPRVITLEEHYQDPDVLRAYAPEDQRQLPAVAEPAPRSVPYPRLRRLAPLRALAQVRVRVWVAGGPQPARRECTQAEWANPTAACRDSRT